MTKPDASKIVEGSSENIEERPETLSNVEDDQQYHGLDRPAPFARSSDPQYIEKPSKNRLGRQHRRHYPAKPLHNTSRTVGLSICGNINAANLPE